MGIESRLLAHESGARQGQTAGFDEQHRQGAVMATHALEIKGLPHRSLSFVGAKTLDKSGPEVIHGR